MDLYKVLAELREELENLDAAILSLERLQQDGRPGSRPPKALAPFPKTAGAPGKGHAGSDDSAYEEN
jgi:hypothetical protein